MMKKKSADTEEKKESGQPKHAGNKDNTAGHTDDQTIGKKAGDENDPEATAETQIADTEQEPDKSVPEENLLQEKLAEMQDRYLRLSAEFDNYRKRTLKEKMEMTKYAGEDLIKKLLPFKDDFERALKHMVVSDESVPVKEGLDLIYVKFSDFLKSQGVKEIDALNSRLDVDIHEAVAKIPVAEEKKKGTIVDVVLKGYFLHDKVIRHAKVVIVE